MTGCIEGPTLAHDEPPWPLLWEQEGTGRHRTEHVVRCRHCHAPRCGHSGDEDPCMERRHHDSLHIYLSGRFEPLGGLLPPESVA